LLDLTQLESLAEGEATWEDQSRLLRPAASSEPKTSVLVRTRTAWIINSRSKPTRPLGTGLSQRIQFIMLLGSHLQFNFVLGKDRWEPFFRSRGDSWLGYEQVRGFGTYSRGAWSLIAGHYRINHGHRLVSGTTSIQSISASSVFRHPATLVSASGYSGTAANPVRRGILVQYSGAITFLLFGSSTRTPASLRTVQTTPSLVENHVFDISTTTAFTSPASIERRARLQIRSSGFTASWKRRKSSTGAFFERVNIYDRQSDTQFPQRLHFAVSQDVRSSWLRGSIEMASTDWQMVDSKGSVRINWKNRGTFTLGFRFLAGERGAVFGLERKLNRSALRARRVVIAWRTSFGEKQEWSIGVVSEQETLPGPPYREIGQKGFVLLRIRPHDAWDLRMYLTLKTSSDSFSTSSWYAHLKQTSGARLSAFFRVDRRTSLRAEYQARSLRGAEANGSVQLVKSQMSHSRRHFSISTALSHIYGNGHRVSVYFSEPTVSHSFPLVSASRPSSRFALHLKSKPLRAMQFEASYRSSILRSEHSRTRNITLSISYMSD